MTPNTPMTPPLSIVGAAPDKILNRGELLALRARARAEARRVVQCHGCFDIVHPGHIRHLRQAKSLGDILLVTLTGDAEMKKGAGRPLIPEELRAENLAALDFVDWVYVEQGPTAADLLEAVRPDVYVKGREYEFNQDPRFKAEREAVERHGGRVVFSSGDVVFSSTALIAAMERSVDPYHARIEQLIGAEELRGPALFSLISAMRGRRVVVIGETIQDTYVMCDRPEVASESPVMTLRPLERRHYDGGAAVVARHAAALGAKAVLVTALPDGEDSRRLVRRLAADGVEVRALKTSGAIPEKQRFLVGAQKVMKLDVLEPLVLDATQQDEFLGLAEEAARGEGTGLGSSAAIITDFGLGLFTPAVMRRLCTTLRPHVQILSGDVSGKRSSLRSMTGMDLLCPSESELREAYRNFAEGLPLVTWNLLQETRAKAAMVTMGAEGLIAFDRLDALEVRGGEDTGWRSRLRGEHVPAMCPIALDPLGCGDAMLATATMTLAAGGSMLAAGFLGACAAGLEVQRLGNIPVNAADLRRMITRVHTAQLAYAGADVIEARGMVGLGAGVLRSA